MNPTYAGFLAFVRSYMMISTAVLPDTSAFLQPAYDTSIGTVNIGLAGVPFPTTSPNFYAQAVYNLGGHVLILTAQDIPGAPPVDGSKPLAPYFQWARTTMRLNSFIGGVISSAGDEGTNESMEVPEALKNLTLSDLQLLQTPWGRAYVSIAQRAGYLVGYTG